MTPPPDDAPETPDAGAGSDQDHAHDHEHGHDHDHAQEIDLTRYEGIERFDVRDLGGCDRELLAVVPRDRFEKEVERRCAQLAKRVTIKGFRQGKAPKARVLALHGDELRKEALEGVVNEVWEEARKEKELRPLGPPTLTEVSFRDGDEPLRFAARFEELPTVTLQGLDGIEASDKSVKVTDEDVEKEIEELRSLRAELIATDRKEASPGDHVAVDLVRWAVGASRLQDEPEEKREGLVVEVGAEGNIPELDRALLGIAVGETRNFDSKYPDDHQDEALRGQEVAFAVTLQEVRERRLPDLDDAFAQGLGDWQTMDALREDLRGRLEESRMDAARREQEDEVLQQLVAANSVAIPRSLIEKEAEARLRFGMQDLAKRGIDPEDPRIDWRKEFERAQETAERDLRNDYLLDLVAVEKEIEISDADVDTEIDDIARRRQATAKEVREHLEKSNQISQLRAALRRRRVLDSLRSGATISVD